MQTIDDLLDSHKAIVEVNSEISNTMAESVALSRRTLLQQQEFATAVQAMQDQIARDAKAVHVDSTNVFRAFLQDAQSGISALFVATSQKTGMLHKQMDHLGSVSLI